MAEGKAGDVTELGLAQGQGIVSCQNSPELWRGGYLD